ncbi:hypothetical protein [Borrelia miyamotoi]
MKIQIIYQTFSLDSNQKQALIFFKDLVKNKKYSENLEKKRKNH